MPRDWRNAPGPGDLPGEGDPQRAEDVPLCPTHGVDLVALGLDGWQCPEPDCDYEIIDDPDPEDGEGGDGDWPWPC